MFQSNDQQQFVATRNVSIKPESIVPYNPTTNNPKFHIPQSLGFIDPSSLFLKYNLKFSGRGCVQPDPAAGALSLWRDCRIQTGDGRTTVEDLQDMNVKTAHDNNLNQNDSINNRRSLYEGRQPRNTRKGDQLFFSPPAANPSAAKDAYELIQLQHGLPQSGILGHQARVFPVMATDGLRVSLTLDSITRSITNWTNNGTVNRNVGSGLAIPDDPKGQDGGFTSLKEGYWDNNKKQRADWLGLWGAADTGGGLVAATANNGEIDHNNPPGPEQKIYLMNSGDAGHPTNEDGSARDAAEGTPDLRPFSVGDLMYVGTVSGGGAETGTSGTAATGCEMLGVISGFDQETDAGGSTRAVIKYYPFGVGRTVDGNGDFKLKRDYPAGSAIFVNPADRMTDAKYIGPGLLAVCVPADLQDAPAVSYEITDLELVVNQVSPPDNYVSALQNQITKQGLNIDYKTTTMYRHNQQTLTGLTNQIIPAVQNRAYNVVSVPLNAEVQNNKQDLRSSFKGIVDGIQNYQYVVGSSLQPNRPVDTKRYNSPSDEPKYEPLHMMELEKATVASMNAVRSWWSLPDDFSVARAFALNNQVHQLNGKDLALRAEYQDGKVPKLYEHFICHVNTLNISSDIATVIR